jgi:hypothetical protein
VCEAWDEERLALMRKTMHWPTSENFVEMMLQSEEDWDAIGFFARCILSKKEEKERERESEGRP